MAVKKVIELQILVEEMISEYEEMCKSSGLLSTENEALSERIDALHSSVVTLQGEKDEVEGKYSAITSENEVVRKIKLKGNGKLCRVSMRQ